jgi:hypothetical protein
VNIITVIWSDPFIVSRVTFQVNFLCKGYSMKEHRPRLLTRWSGDAQQNQPEDHDNDDEEGDDIFYSKDDLF